MEIKVDSINVTTTRGENNVDEDGDVLSSYIMNLGLVIRHQKNGLFLNKTKISPTNFKLKSVNLEARSKMEVFIECLAQATLSAIVGGAIEGSINIIEETVNYILDYTSESIINVINSNVDFKPIKCQKDSFVPFYPNEKSTPALLFLSFPIKKEYLESKNIIVLAIDSVFRIEKRIFLITRPK